MCCNAILFLHYDVTRLCFLLYATCTSILYHLFYFAFSSPIYSQMLNLFCSGYSNYIDCISVMYFIIAVLVLQSLRSIQVKIKRYAEVFVVSVGINYFQHTPSKEWFQTDAVLRVSLGNFLFFTILAVLMIGVKNQKDPRDNVHHGGWMMKIISWCLLVLLMFFVPNGFISFYGTSLLALFAFLDHQHVHLFLVAPCYSFL